MNRRPSLSRRYAPAPRTASLIRNRLDPATYSTVGWNCMNSMSRNTTPARYAAAMPSPVATGDGMAAAYRAGVVLRDMEFMQFHPTVLYVAGSSRFLISEAVRGAGAYLRDNEGRRFMPDVDPRAELATRDVVAQAIVRT